jgi:hypothetical protein
MAPLMALSFQILNDMRNLKAIQLYGTIVLS